MGCTCSSPSPPPVIINPGATAGQQATFNEEAALKQRALNMVDQYTPQGSMKWTPELGPEGEPATVEGIPQFRATTEYSPEQQGLYETSTRLAQQYADIGERQLGAVSESLAIPFTTEGLGPAPEVNEAQRTATIESILGRMQPQLTRDRSALETSLANQGFSVGSEGYDSAMDERNRALADIYLGADVQAGNEMARMYGLESNVRDRAINEILMQRTQPMSELASFMSGSQPTSPSFVPVPQGQIAAPDFMGASYLSAGQQNMYNMGQQNLAMQNRQGLYGLLGTGAQAAGMTYGGPGWTWGR